MSRLACAERLASYSGLVPVVHASGGRVFYGPTTNHSNPYLRGAFVEAANLARRAAKRIRSGMSANSTSGCAPPRDIKKPPSRWLDIWPNQRGEF